MPVEEFKTFYVYEDVAEKTLQQKHVAGKKTTTITSTTTTTQSLEVDKENLCVAASQQRLEIKRFV